MDYSLSGADRAGTTGWGEHGGDMPYAVHKRGDKYVVVKKDDGKVMGTHESLKKARAQIKAIYANEAR